MKSKKTIFFIIGPTASGKTALSIKLAKEIKNAEIISVDSRQIFKDLNLSTGKITNEEMENIPHHLLDIINPGEYFSVVDFTEIALQKINEIFERGNTPIICGGTAFYIDSLLFKYNLPEVKKNDELRAELKNKTQEQLFKILQDLNFDSASKIENNFEYRNNKHRMMRRIEVVKELGYFPELVKIERFSREEFDIKILQTSLRRKDLKERIYKRLLERLDAGMIDEIKNVKEKYNLDDKYLKGLGLEFKWVSKYLNKEIEKEEMIEKLFFDIYHYAKRQEQWFKRYDLLFDNSSGEFIFQDFK